MRRDRDPFRRVVAAGLAILGVTVLAACSNHRPLTKEERMTTPDESISALYAFYDATLDVIGHEGWTLPPADANSLGVIPEECELPDGKAGVRYSDLLGGPGFPKAEHEKKTKLVAEAWREWGLTAHDIPPTNPKSTERYVRAEGTDLGATYSAGVRGSSIAIVMRCIPGDFIALADGVIEHRASQSPEATP